MTIMGMSLDLNKPPTRDENSKLIPIGSSVKKYQSIEPVRSTLDNDIKPVLT